jgi:hypothetical protein
MGLCSDAAGCSRQLPPIVVQELFRPHATMQGAAPARRALSPASLAMGMANRQSRPA